MSVRTALTWGILLVQTPSLLIVVVLSFLLYDYLVFHDLSPWYIVPIGIGILSLGQFWWRIAIVKWKIWAYSNVEHLRELHRRAQQIALTHDRQPLQGWELISQQDRLLLYALNQRIEHAMEDTAIAPNISYYFSRTKALASVFMIHLIAIGAILFLLQTNASKLGFYLALLILVLYVLMYFVRLPIIDNPILTDAFHRLFSQKPQIKIDAKGINLHYKNTGFIEWANIKNFQIKQNKAQKELILFLQLSKQEYQKLIVPLSAYALDTDELERVLAHYIYIH